MANFPGTPGATAPAGEDYLIRRITDLERQVRELGPSIAESFTGTVQTLTDTVNHLNSLTTTSTAGTSINSGAVAGDSTFHWIDDAPVLSITVTAATGRVLLTIGCGEATILPGEASAVAAISVAGSAPDGWAWPLERFDARVFSTSNVELGAPLIVSAPVDVPATEPVTFTVKLGVWSASTATLASAEFAQPYIIAAVIN